MKRITKNVVIVLTACLLLLFYRNPVQAEKESNGIDAVIVIDNSGSMKKTDPNRISMEAANLFLDMMSNSGSKVGLVSFSDTINIEQPLSDINGSETKQEIKNVINHIQYAGDTDIGLALSKAAEMLDQAGNDGNDKMILFLTDGTIDLTDESKGRTEAQSYDDAYNTIDRVKGQYTIFSIGLNANGQVNHSLLNRMADSTGGTCHIIDSIEGLADIYTGIFASFQQSMQIRLTADEGYVLTDDYYELSFNVPNESVLETNIIMLSSTMLDDIQILEPGGIERMIDQENISVERANSYSLMKLVNPKMGDWKLRLKGQAGCVVKISMICTYDAELVQECSINEEKNEMTIKAYFVAEGSVIENSVFYEDFFKGTGSEVKLLITFPDGEQKEKGMKLGNNSFGGILDLRELTGKGNYKIVVHAKSLTMERDSNEYIYTSDGVVATPEPTKEPAKVEFKGVPGKIVLKGLVLSNLSESIDYGQYVKSSTNDYEIEISGLDTSIVSARLDSDKKQIKLNANSNGTTDLVLKVKTNEGNVVQKTIKVEVEAAFMNWLPIILGSVLIIAAVLALLWLIPRIKISRRRFQGILNYNIHNENEFGNSANEGRKKCQLSRYKGKRKLSELLSEINQAGMQLDKIFLIPMQRSGTIKIVNRSAKTVKKGFAGTAQKNFFINDKDQVIIVLDSSKTIVIEYRKMDVINDDGGFPGGGDFGNGFDKDSAGGFSGGF